MIKKETTTTTTDAQFGDVMPLRSSSSSSSSSSSVKPIAITAPTAQFGEVMPLEAQVGDVMPLRSSPLNPMGGAQFGEVLSLQKPTAATAEDTEYRSGGSSRRLLRSVITDIHIQYTHPTTPIQLLVQMEKNSARVETIGRNSTPTVILIFGHPDAAAQV